MSVNYLSRDRTVTTNVVNFTGGLSFRMEKAIVAFDDSNQSKELYEEFYFLLHQGISEAHFFIACMHEDGTNGQIVNIKTALGHYESAISEIGYVEAYLAAARLYLIGTPSVTDIERSFNYYQTVAEKTNNSVACFRLGRMYHLGVGAEPNRIKANLLYEQAIQQGSIYGMLFAAQLAHENGRYLRWFFLRVKAINTAVILSIKNRRDMRLRAW
jgi:TPR repeat protein